MRGRVIVLPRQPRFAVRGTRLEARQAPSLRFRRTPCELSQTNLRPFDFPISIQLFGRPTMICNAITKGTGAMFPIELKNDHKYAPDKRLFNCEQLSAFVFPKLHSSGETSATLLRTSNHLLLTWDGSNGNSMGSRASARRPAAGDCRVGELRSGIPRAFWYSSHLSFPCKRPIREC